jgi:DNA-binding CsgD family transcriptional regulator
MQAQPINDALNASRQNPGDPQDIVLLIGSEDAFKSDATYRILSGFHFRIAGQVTTLLEGLSQMESKTIDVVLLSNEFCDEELSLFAFDAQRRGFTGLILHVASLPHEMPRTTPQGRSGWQNWEGESHEGLQRHSGEQHQLSSHASDLKRRLELNEAAGSISFTPRQQAVLARVSEGWTNQQIAHDLKYSEGSVKAVLQELFKKLGVRKRAQIVRMAFEKIPWNPTSGIIRPGTTQRGHGK